MATARANPARFKISRALLPVLLARPPTNSILARNTATTGPDCYASLTSGGYNLLGIGDRGCSGLTNGVNGDQVGTGSSPLNPWLDPLADLECGWSSRGLRRLRLLVLSTPHSGMLGHRPSLPFRHTRRPVFMGLSSPYLLDTKSTAP
jgi:hypothetical protein